MFAFCFLGQMEPEVKFHSIGIISDEFGEINSPLPVAENQSRVLFTLKEGSRYQLKLTFTVLHNIVSGLTYSNTVWKGGLQGEASFPQHLRFKLWNPLSNFSLNLKILANLNEVLTIQIARLLVSIEWCILTVSRLQMMNCLPSSHITINK